MPALFEGLLERERELVRLVVDVLDLNLHGNGFAQLSPLARLRQALGLHLAGASALLGRLIHKQLLQYF